MSIPPEDIAQWARRIRSRYPIEAMRYTPVELEESLAGWLDLLAPLGLDDQADRVRFLNLCVLLTPEQRRSQLVQGVLRRVMCNRDWEPKRRLDIVYKYLVGRPVKVDEEDFGSRFAPS